MVGRFCFVPGDTLNWPENADQNISTDVCDACWMSAPAWSYYDSMLYSDSLLSPGPCDVYDHCHHSAPDSILCGVGYMDGTDSTSVSINEIDYILENYLLINYPNPFNPSTEILYKIPKDDYISIVIFNLKGNKVMSLVDDYQSAGMYAIHWNGKNEQGKSVSAGMYIYSLQAGSYRQTKKMVLLK